MWHKPTSGARSGGRHKTLCKNSVFGGENVFLMNSTLDLRRSNTWWSSVWTPSRLFDAAMGTVFLLNMGRFLSIHQSPWVWHHYTLVDSWRGKRVWLVNLTSCHYFSLMWRTHADFFLFLSFRASHLSVLPDVVGENEYQMCIRLQRLLGTKGLKLSAMIKDETIGHMTR